MLVGSQRTAPDYVGTACNLSGAVVVRRCAESERLDEL